MTWPEGVGRVVVDAVDSTMDEARRRLQETPAPFWLLARRQTAARGRRGRAWMHPEGNFSATLVLAPPEPAAVVALRSYVAALALHDAVSDLLGPGAALSLKWPNDLLLNGGKLAGILLEANGQGRRTDRLLIGIGVNLRVCPPANALEATAIRAVSLAEETGLAVTPETLLDHLAPAYARWERRFAEEGFAPVRKAWLSRAARLGAEITARTGAQETRGVFETVDLEGQLVLKTREGRVAIAAADVHF